MNKFACLLLFAACTVLSAVPVGEVLVAGTNGVSPAVLATPQSVANATNTQRIVSAQAESVAQTAARVQATIDSMFTNSVVLVTGYCQSANSASAVPDTNVVIRPGTLLVTNGWGYAVFNSTKILTVAPELRFSESPAPKKDFTNIVDGVVSSWPDTVPNPPQFTNGVSYSYSFRTTTPNGFYYLFSDPMIVPPSGEAILVSGTVMTDGWIGIGLASAPEIHYDLDGKQMTLVGGSVVYSVPVPISTLMAYVGRSRLPMKIAMVQADRLKGRTL